MSNALRFDRQNLDDDDMQRRLPVVLESKQFIAAHNRLTRIPAAVLSMTCLTHLSLAFCQLRVLPDQIRFLRHLSGLYVQHNRLCHLPVAPLLALEALSELFLEGNPLPPELALNCKAKHEVQMVVLEAAALYQRHHNCRRAVVALLAVRRFRRYEPEQEHVARLLTYCPRELFEAIARLVWATRSSACWAGEIRQSTRLFHKRQRR